ncbi:hypothetical protein SERLA73DRAFT_180088 [Serpula lacrymans var. lacrymans S7.3]|uniref:NAD(P)-binding protein n=2 Tax=Serpula lacrymans var. lacrymans TaxID=341189 RepID=F8PVM9_SERL3|nr:uncharacterized protein SERLADRAFT_465540 [Serpula lacrymans var. lacrymans S7.9]EGN99846.1 hypothetical protein SERLA73DRAFT_180088 [Serpula lacrymans var. lacrymans S7.3]EGO25414.1 hypothetical protein SERLADRAFT_465540 [Serpula lacrymans var. lacrymans S7.9]
MTSPRVWFVTGASSGFGRVVVEHVLKKGDIAVATLRKPDMLSDLVEQYPSSRLLTLRLDVTDPAETTAAFNKAIETYGRIDVVFNNAGYCVISEAEGISETSARGQFEVMFWGAANVTKEAVKCFRDINRPIGGRLLQMSSRSAFVGAVGVAHYGAAKAALECLTEGWAAELDPRWNIKITLVEPALFRTPAPSKNFMEPPHPAYADPSLPSSKYRSLYPGVERIFTGDPAKLAQAMYRLSELEDPPFRLPLHKVALDTARRKGESLIKAVDEYASWSDDIYLSDSTSS